MFMTPTWCFVFIIKTSANIGSCIFTNLNINKFAWTIICFWDNAIMRIWLGITSKYFNVCCATLILFFNKTFELFHPFCTTLISFYFFTTFYLDNINSTLIFFNSVNTNWKIWIYWSWINTTIYFNFSLTILWVNSNFKLWNLLWKTNIFWFINWIIYNNTTFFITAMTMLTLCSIFWSNNSLTAAISMTPINIYTWCIITPYISIMITNINWCSGSCWNISIFTNDISFKITYKNISLFLTTYIIDIFPACLIWERA